MTVYELVFHLPKGAQRQLFSSKLIARKLFGESFGLDRMDRWIADNLDSDTEKYFVEVGANDGFLQSNSKYFEMFHSWQGILVEPLSREHIRQFQTRSNSTIKVRAACVPEGFSEPYVELISSGLMTTTDSATLEGISSAKAHSASGGEYLPYFRKVQKESSPAKTLTQILKQAQAPRVFGLLSVDVEGFELDVLRGLDFEQFTPQNIAIESRSYSKVEELLRSKGYGMDKKFDDINFLFKLAR